MRTSSPPPTTSRSKDAPAPSGAPNTIFGSDGIPDWAGRASVLAIGVALAIIAFAYHPVGDYYTESDFYGGYADGARQILAGRIDPARYGVVGPVYEAVLAMVTSVVRDPFVAARLLSVAAAIAALWWWQRVWSRRFPGFAAVTATLLLALNPVFVRHGVSATTDMLALATQTLALFALFGGSPAHGGDHGIHARRAAAAGAATAFAILTRYSSVYLVPVSIVALLWTDAAPPGRRGRAIASYGASLLAILAPWTLFAAAHGHLPGEVLVRSFGFYFDLDPTRNVQDAPVADSLGIHYPSLVEIVSRPVDLSARMAENLPAHLTGDARSLIGWPTALLAAFGLLASATPSWRRAVAPIAIAFAGGFLILLPVFHSERYSLPLAPFYAGFAGVGVAAMSRFLPGRPGRTIAWLLSLAAVLTTLAACVDLEVRVHMQLPIEVVDAGRALAADSPPDARVMSRKGHVGYYASRTVVAFPRCSTLAELAASARRQGASHLYYSWYESSLRPEFVWMLDTTATAPGLHPIQISSGNPAVLYRIGTGFGADPAWMSDDFERRLHEARARIAVDPDSLTWTHRTVLGVDALRSDRPQDALEMVAPVTHSHPEVALAWVVSGEAGRRLRYWDQAEGDFRQALRIDGLDVDARAGLGRLLRDTGRTLEAMEVWRPILERTDDRELLTEMVAMYSAANDETAARIARRRLEGRTTGAGGSP